MQIIWRLAYLTDGRRRELMLFVCLWLCDSYRCSKLILIPEQAVIGSRARVFQYFTQTLQCAVFNCGNEFEE